MTIWEYQTLDFAAASGPAIGDACRTMGALGWELAGVVQGGGNCQLIFKRPKGQHG